MAVAGRALQNRGVQLFVYPCLRLGPVPHFHVTHQPQSEYLRHASWGDLHALAEAYGAEIRVDFFKYARRRAREIGMEIAAERCANP
jgi:hypothetical protein